MKKEKFEIDFDGKNLTATEIANNDGFALYELSESNGYIENPSREFLNEHFSNVEIDTFTHSYLVKDNNTDDFKLFF